MVNPYATAEPHAELWFEQTGYAGNYIAAVAYGMHIMIFSMCIYHILRSQQRHAWLWIPVCFAFLVLGTLNLSMNAYFGELAYIDNRQYPGGPLAYLLDKYAGWVGIIGNSASVIAEFLAEGILIYRVYVVWNSYLIVVIPILSWLAATVLGALTTYQSARPNASLWTHTTEDISVPYLSLSMALNIVLTLLLILRLLFMRRKISITLGPEYGKLYAGMASMILESALPYGLVSLIFVILYNTHNTAARLFLALLVQVQCMTPMLILLRIMSGKALSNDSISETELSKLKLRYTDGSEGPSTPPGSMRKITFRPGVTESRLMNKEIV